MTSRVLASVAVAFGDGITVDALARVHDCDTASIEAVLEAADPAVITSATFWDDDPRRWCLTDTADVGAWFDPADPDFVAHLADAHRRIALGLRDGLGRHDDRYPIEYLIAHLCDAHDRWDDRATDPRIEAADIVAVATGWPWLEARICHDGSVDGAVTDLIQVIDTSANSPGPGVDDYSRMDPVDDTGHDPHGLLRALQLNAKPLGDAANQPWRIAQQLQHFAVRTGDARADAAARTRLVHHGQPNATLSWTTQRIHPALHRMFSAGPSTLTGLEWSPDGSLLAASTDEGAVCVWAPATGSVVSSSRLVLERGRLVAWSPDGLLLAAGGSDGTVTVRAPKSGTMTAARGLFVGGVLDLSWSPDSDRIAATSDHGEALLWRVHDDTVCTLDHGDRHACDVVWSIDGHYVISTSIQHEEANSYVHRWDAETGTQLSSSSTGAYDTELVRLSPDGEHAAIFAYGCDVSIVETATGNEVARLTGHLDEVKWVQWAPDSRTIATFGADRMARIWDAVSGGQRAVLDGLANSQSKFGWAPTSAHVAACAVGRLSIWDAESGSVHAVLDDVNTRDAFIRWSPDGERLAAGRESIDVVVWDLSAVADDDGATDVRRPEVGCVAVSPHGRYVAGVDADTVWIRHADSGTTRLAISPGRVSTKSIAWSPDGRQLAFIDLLSHGSSTWHLELLDVASGHVRTASAIPASDQGEPQVMHWSMDRIMVGIPAVRYQHIICCDLSHNGSVSEHLIAGPAKGSLKPLPAWSPLGRCATAVNVGDPLTWTSRIRLYNEETGGSNIDIDANVQFVTAIAWSPDAQRVAAASETEPVRVWNTNNGSEVAALPASSQRMQSIVWSPDGEMIAGTDDFGTVRIWTVDSDRVPESLVVVGEASAPVGANGEVWIDWSEGTLAVSSDGDVSVFDVGHLARSVPGALRHQ